MKVYQHYKGGLYAVVTDTALDDKDNLMVVYCNIQKDYFVQTLARFREQVEVDGELVPRFTLVYDDVQEEFFTPPSI